MSKPIIIIDGSQFSTWEEFRLYFSAVALEDWEWNGNLNAFNDILRGGFGTPLDGFILRWENSSLSRERLGETLFDEVVEIIRNHGQGGREAMNDIELQLV